MKTLKYIFLILVVLIVIGCSSIDFSEIVLQHTEYAVVEEIGIVGHLGLDIYETVKDSLPRNTKSMEQYLNSFKEHRMIQLYDFPQKKEVRNVILIQLEGIDSITLDIQKAGQLIMPNINELKNNGIFFENVYDQTGSGRTSDGESAALLSLLPIENASIYTSYDIDGLTSLPKIMSRSGRKCYAFHGNNGSYWNRQSAQKALGYDKGFYSEQIGKEIELEYSGWGLSDRTVLQAAFAEIQNSREALFAHIILMTAHHPYDGVNNMELDLPYEHPATDIESYINTLYYTDLVVGEFVDQLSESGILEESILVIFSDHDSGITKNVYQYMNEPYFEGYICDKIPLIIYDGVNQYVDSTIMGQTDIMPLLCSYLDQDIPENIMGGNYIDGKKVVYLPRTIIKGVGDSMANSWNMKRITEAMILLGAKDE